MRKKVLVLDDNPHNSHSYLEAVQSHFDVSVAYKIVTALRLIRERYYDYIVIDVMMPSQGMTSKYELTYELTTGFEFYRDYIMPLNLDSKVIFWSRLDKAVFTSFWEYPPKNVSYLQKSDSFLHLLDYLLELEKEK